MKIPMLLVLSAVASAAFADAPSAPLVSNVSIVEQSPKKVVVAYDLANEDAIITLDILTNGVPVSKALVAKYTTGDAFKVVAAGSGRKVAVWNARDAIPGVRASQNVVATARVTAWKKGAPPDYYVLDLTDGSKAFYETEDCLPLGINNDVYRTTKMVFRRIHADGEKFIMGAPSAETTAAGVTRNKTGYMGYETQHEVAFSKDFFIGVFELTQAQWRKVYGSIPPAGSNANAHRCMPQGFTDANETLPVQSCAKTALMFGVEKDYPRPEDATAGSFLGNLRATAGAGSMYAIPTEAQWEYACRAGTETAFNDGRDYNANTDYSDIARYNSPDKGPLRVGTLKPNAWGLYDMHGNIYEWTLDMCLQMSQDTEDPTLSPVTQDETDPDHQGGGTPLRGGSYEHESSMCRAAAHQTNFYNKNNLNYFGFRVSCPIDQY